MDNELGGHKLPLNEEKIGTVSYTVDPDYQGRAEAFRAGRFWGLIAGILLGSTIQGIIILLLVK